MLYKYVEGEKYIDMLILHLASAIGGKLQRTELSDRSEHECYYLARMVLHEVFDYLRQQPLRGVGETDEWRKRNEQKEKVIPEPKHNGVSGFY